MDDDECYGFPAQMTHSQAQRLAARVFAARSRWRLYPTPAHAAAAAQRQELTDLVLTHGTLRSQRGELWWLLTLPHGGPAIASEYAAVAARAADIPHAVARQIELDLPRTFCEQADFAAAHAALEHDGSRRVDIARVIATAGKSGSGSSQDALRRMLYAFALLHPDCGYLQSLNYVAAFCLIVVGRGVEDRAFAVFECVAARLLAGYYADDMSALKLDSAVFSALLEERQPALAAHLRAHALEDLPSLFLPRWLLCVFLNCFPVWITARVWDALLLEGDQAPRFLLEVSLAVLRIVRDDLLNATSFGDAAEVLKTVGARVVDASELLLLTRSPECSLQGTSIDEWRLSHGGHELARYAASTSGKARLLAVRAAAESATTANPKSSPAPASPHAKRSRRSAVIAPASGETGVAAGSVAHTVAGAASAVRDSSRRAGPSPAAAAAARGATSTPTASVTTSVARDAAKPAAAVVPPVDLDTAFDRVFSPLAASPLAQRHQLMRAGSFRAALDGGASESPARLSMRRGLSLASLPLLDPSAPPGTASPAASAADVAQRLPTSAADVAQRLLTRKRTFRAAPAASPVAAGQMLASPSLTHAAAVGVTAAAAPLSPIDGMRFAAASIAAHTADFASNMMTAAAAVIAASSVTTPAASSMRLDEVRPQQRLSPLTTARLHASSVLQGAAVPRRSSALTSPSVPTPSRAAGARRGPTVVVVPTPTPAATTAAPIAAPSVAPQTHSTRTTAGGRKRTGTRVRDAPPPVVGPEERTMAAAVAAAAAGAAPPAYPTAYRDHDTRLGRSEGRIVEMQLLSPLRRAPARPR